MFHLVFQNNKHRTNPYYLSRNVNRASTHNQFELDTIRGALKTRWEVTGFGKTEFQNQVWDVESFDSSAKRTATQYNHRYLHGHIITVTSNADAIWFRLNHENVSKNGCRLVEIYKDLDPDVVVKFYEEASQANKEFRNLENAYQSVNYITNTIGRLQGNSTINSNQKLKDVVDPALETVINMNTTIVKTIDNIRTKSVRVNKKLFDYLDDHRTVV